MPCVVLRVARFFPETDDMPGAHEGRADDNVKADEYVVVFGISQEGETLAECSEKLDATVQAITDPDGELQSFTYLHSADRYLQVTRQASGFSAHCMAKHGAY